MEGGSYPGKEEEVIWGKEGTKREVRGKEEGGSALEEEGLQRTALPKPLRQRPEALLADAVGAAAPAEVRTTQDTKK